MRYFLLFSFVILLGAGCTENKVEQNNSDSMALTQEPISETSQVSNISESQSVQFFMSHGWVGGFGETVLSSAGGEALKVGGKPLYISSEYVSKILTAGAMPSCVVGIPEIFVDAVITLVPQSNERQIGPDEVETTEYFSVEVSEIKEVVIKVEEC
jgi:hypothetical protein